MIKKKREYYKKGHALSIQMDKAKTDVVDSQNGV